jgi:hypothetical protein
LNGDVEPHECLVDATPYDETTSYEKEKYWSDQLGIPVLGKDEMIDSDYRYHTDS